MKGIILAGGSGTRLYPATLAVNKQLLPVYDKPMIYFPLATLMLAGIKEVLIISSPEYIDSYRRLFGSGENYGIYIEYAVQPRPEGLAQAFHIGAGFLNGGAASLILGDNIFYGAGLSEMLLRSRERALSGNATIFGYEVNNPSDYGVVDLDSDDRAIAIDEKPKNPKSNWAVTGLYFYDHRVTEMSYKVKPSPRGELEITDLNRIYMEAGGLTVEKMGRGYAWLDTGTHDSLLEASEFVRTLQHRQGIQIACLEEIAWKNGWISDKELEKQANLNKKTNYGRFLFNLLS